ncbi:hypothetical protein K1W54_04880 [Micromonospora sp. CPCC 205371]|nr:hypothetical protein [Micromonospora sp. CPCC 205371]
MPEKVASWRKVPCPSCLARRLQPCRTADGREATEPHAARRQAGKVAELPAPLLSYGWGGEWPHIVSAADPRRALCGVGLVVPPVLQPSLESAHPQCKNLLGKVDAATAIAPTGVCPVCVSEEDLDEDGRIKAHKQMYGGRRTDVDCDGAGQKPEDDQ